MTPDDKRRLAEMPQMVGPGPETDTAAGTIRFLRRLLDEAMAETAEVRAGWRREHENWTSEIQEIVRERDAAMAALRELTTTLRVRPDMASLIGPKESAIFYHAEAVLAAHSAATRPTEEVSG